MNWPILFLGCFVVGLVFSALAFVLGAAGLHVHAPSPFPHAAHGLHPHGAAHGGVARVNFATVMAFLAWFGGTGYLLTSGLGWLALPALVVAAAAGLAGAAIVFWVMARLLWSPDENMMSADSQMVGVYGRVNQTIRAGGIGEVIYSRGGARSSCGARSADGAAIEKGAEVVITSYERGIAQVQRWDDLAADKR